ncbi:MAG: hypothetical protein ORN50_00970 [Crocinitomicaceae bacterium]|nr:hypothetical protein [Crocinitomicaceae bacterium]
MSKVKYDADQVQSVFDANPSITSLIITSCGNVFLKKHESYAKSHCREAKTEYAELTREQFNSENKDGKSKASTLAAPTQTDWKLGKFKEIVEFAKENGLNVQTKPNQGVKVLVPEVEALLAEKAKTLEEAIKAQSEKDADSEKVETGADSEEGDYEPVDQ